MDGERVWHFHHSSWLKTAQKKKLSLFVLEVHHLSTFLCPVVNKSWEISCKTWPGGTWFKMPSRSHSLNSLVCFRNNCGDNLLMIKVLMLRFWWCGPHFGNHWAMLLALLPPYLPLLLLYFPILSLLCLSELLQSIKRGMYTHPAVRTHPCYYGLLTGCWQIFEVH